MQCLLSVDSGDLTWSVYGYNRNVRESCKRSVHVEDVFVVSVLRVATRGDESVM